AVMTGGFSNIASGVLGVYADMLSAIPNAGGHLLAASVISAPAGLVVAKLIMPETETPVTNKAAKVEAKSDDTNVLDAAVRGTRDGLILAANVGAVLIVFTAGVWLANEVLAWGCDAINDGLGVLGMSSDPMPILTIQGMLGRVFQPVAWLCGVPWVHSNEVGQLIGLKTALNEFFGYQGMAVGLGAAGENYLGGTRQQLITLYALCGFANFASVGIQIGGIGVLAPSRRKDLAKIGLLAMVGGTIASLLTACVVGIIV
ncbi:MAG: nucleoside transporter C-terminal domain-containing protein, partial [Planctomycetota bacterium]